MSSQKYSKTDLMGVTTMAKDITFVADAQELIHSKPCDIVNIDFCK